MTPICDLTWDVVRARSTETTRSGLTYYCGHCDVQFHNGGTPCPKHTLAAETSARGNRITELLKGLRL